MVDDRDMRTANLCKNKLHLGLNCKILATLILVTTPVAVSAEMNAQHATEVNQGGDPKILQQVETYLSDFASKDLEASTSSSFDYLRININNVGDLDYLIYPHTIYFCGAKGDCSLLAVLDSSKGDFRVVTELDGSGKPVIAARFASANHHGFSQILTSKSQENENLNDILVPDFEGNMRVWKYDIPQNRYLIRQ